MNRRIMKRWLVSCAAGLLVFSTGCLKIDATLTINRTGGGTLRAMYGMPAFLVRQLEVTRQWTHALDLAVGRTNSAPLPELDIPMVFDEAALKTRFRKMETEGVTVDSYRCREQGAWQYVDMTLKFERLETLLKQPCFRECAISLKALGQEGLKLSLTPPGSGSDLPAASLSSPEAITKLTPFVNGLRIVVRIDVPGEIRNTTALISDSRRATWEWDFEKDSHVIERLAQDKMILVFDGTGARLREFDKPAGSTFVLVR